MAAQPTVEALRLTRQQHLNMHYLAAPQLQAPQLIPPNQAPQHVGSLGAKVTRHSIASRLRKWNRLERHGMRYVPVMISS